MGANSVVIVYCQSLGALQEKNTQRETPTSKSTLLTAAMKGVAGSFMGVFLQMVLVVCVTVPTLCLLRCSTVSPSEPWNTDDNHPEPVSFFICECKERDSQEVADLCDDRSLPGGWSCDRPLNSIKK